MVEFGPNGQVLGDVAGPTFRALTGRYKFLRSSLLVYVFGAAGLAIWSLFESFFKNALGTNLYLIGLLVFGIVGSFGLLAYFIALFTWTHRAMTNLHVIKNPLVNMSPNWAVGWYFIPIANLFKPFHGMVQIWDGSEDASFKYMPGRARLVWWWGTSIASTLITLISIRFFGWEPVGEEYLTSLYFECASTVFGLASFYFLLKITKQVTDAQTLIQEAGVEATFA